MSKYPTMREWKATEQQRARDPQGRARALDALAQPDVNQRAAREHQARVEARIESIRRDCEMLDAHIARGVRRS